MGDTVGQIPRPVPGRAGSTLPGAGGRSVCAWQGERAALPRVSEDGQSTGVKMLGSKTGFGFLAAAGCFRAARKLGSYF